MTEHFIYELTWILVGIAILGKVFVIKKNVIGFYLWGISNVGWVAYNFYVGIYSQGVLYLVFFIFSIWGVIHWSKDHKIEKESYCD